MIGKLAPRNNEHSFSKMHIFPLNDKATGVGSTRRIGESGEGNWSDCCGIIGDYR